MPSSSQSVLCSREPPTESEKAPRVAASLLAAWVKKLTGLVDEVVPRSQRGELDKITSIQRKVGHFLGGDDLSKRGIRGFHRYMGGADFDRRRNRRRVERVIDLALLVNLQAKVFLLGGLETLGLDSDGEDRNGQQGDDVVSRAIGLRFTNETRRSAR